MRTSRVLVFGVAVILSGCASGGQTVSRNSYNASVISQAEIDGSHARTIYDAIRQVRPTFLHVQGQASYVNPTSAQLAVYLDQRFLGDVTAMDQIPASHIAEARYYRPAEAAIKFGTNASGGVIALTTR